MLGFLAYSSSPRWFPELVSRERGFFALVVAVWFSAPGDGACVVEFEMALPGLQLETSAAPFSFPVTPSRLVM